MDVRIRSKLSAKETFLRIGAGVDPPDFAVSPSGFAGRNPLLGSMSDDDTFRFLLFRRRLGMAFVGPCHVTPFFYGVVRSRPGGAEVIGVLTFYPFVTLLIALHLLGSAVGAAVCAGTVVAIGEFPPAAGWASFACAFLGGGMLALGRWFARADGPVIRRYLMECVEDPSGPYR
jgi:hypothetical protein